MEEAADLLGSEEEVLELQEEGVAEFRGSVLIFAALNRSQDYPNVTLEEEEASELQEKGVAEFRYSALLRGALNRSANNMVGLVIVLNRQANLKAR